MSAQTVYILTFYLESRASTVFEWATKFNNFRLCCAVVCTWCVILKIARMHYVLPLSDFPPGLICSLQIDVTFVRSCEK